jgi:hypothetical protein
VRSKHLRLVGLAAAVVLLWSAPAAAAPVAASEAQRFWFYWIAPLLVLAGLGIVGMLALGYYVRVIRPRSRGRKVT